MVQHWRWKGWLPPLRLDNPNAVCFRLRDVNVLSLCSCFFFCNEMQRQVSVAISMSSQASLSCFQNTIGQKRSLYRRLAIHVAHLNIAGQGALCCTGWGNYKSYDCLGLERWTGLGSTDIKNADQAKGVKVNQGAGTTSNVCGRQPGETYCCNCCLFMTLEWASLWAQSLDLNVNCCIAV